MEAEISGRGIIVGKPLHCSELLLSSGLKIGLRITCSRLLNELFILFPQSTSSPYLPAHLLRTGEESVIINPVMRGSRFLPNTLPRTWQRRDAQ